MSKNKKLVKAIRERMSRTGESYSTARMHLVSRVVEVPPEAPQVVLPEPLPQVPPEPPRRVLSGWVPDPNPALPRSTLTRLLQGPASSPTEAKPLIVIDRLRDWAVILAPGLTGPIQGRFAAPSAEVACLYADDYLHGLGYVGPGIGPLPDGYPKLKDRVDARVPSRFSRSVMEEGARCECGHVGEEIGDRYHPCPSCGGVYILGAQALAEHLRKMGAPA